MELFISEFEANTPFLPGSIPFPTLEVKTCQRSFLMSWDRTPSAGARRTFEGVDAYEFLLRFACGLESEIKGETDVFGQLKTAIKEFTDSHPGSEHCTLFSKIFEDTKEIRSQYLQGIGGNTYGALARRVLAPVASSRVTLLGAGQISKSIAPYFADSNLSIFNRTPERLTELKTGLAQKGYENITYTSDSKTLPEILAHSDLILIATPVNSPLDSQVCEVLNALPESERPVVLHLGGQAHEVKFFTEAGIAILSLSDLFALEKEQSFLREKQIKQAMDACHRRALLRSMAKSISIPHGWEDLALFY